MKKTIILVCIVAFTFSSVSCIGWESGVVSTKTDQNVNTKTTKIQARINQVNMEKWSDGSVNVHAAVEIENTGQEKFKITNIEFQIISTDGKILKDTNDTSNEFIYIINTYPKILHPGDIGFAGITLPLNDIFNPKDVKKAEVTVRYTQTLQTDKEILVKDIEIIPHDSRYVPYSDIPRVKAEVSILNNTNHVIKDYTACVILFGENNQILGVLDSNYYNADYALKPGESEPFTLRSRINFDIVYPKIKTVKGFCWTYSK